MIRRCHDVLVLHVFMCDKNHKTPKNLSKSHRDRPQFFSVFYSFHSAVLVDEMLERFNYNLIRIFPREVIKHLIHYNVVHER